VPFAAMLEKFSFAAGWIVQSKYLSFHSESDKAHIVHSGLKTDEASPVTSEGTAIYTSAEKQHFLIF